MYIHVHIYTHIYIYIYKLVGRICIGPADLNHRDRNHKSVQSSGVNRGQREHKGSFRGYPKIRMFLVEDRGSFRGYPLNYPP